MLELTFGGGREMIANGNLPLRRVDKEEVQVHGG